MADIRWQLRAVCLCCGVEQIVTGPLDKLVAVGKSLVERGKVAEFGISDATAYACFMLDAATEGPVYVECDGSTQDWLIKSKEALAKPRRGG